MIQQRKRQEFPVFPARTISEVCRPNTTEFEVVVIYPVERDEELDATVFVHLAVGSCLQCSDTVLSHIKFQPDFRLNMTDPEADLWTIGVLGPVEACDLNLSGLGFKLTADVCHRKGGLVFERLDKE